MEKTKLLTITVFGLLLLNLGTLSFLFFNSRKEHRPTHDRHNPKEIIIDKLHFDAAQQKEFGKLIQRHQGEIKKLDGNIREAKNELYKQLSKVEVNVKTKDSLIMLLNTYQKQIEETHFKHFEDIKKLCHQDQMESFNALTEELVRLFAPNKLPRPRHE